MVSPAIVIYAIGNMVDAEKRTPLLSRFWAGVSESFPPKDRRVQRFATAATVVFFAFVLGFVPMWLTARTRGAERNAAAQALRIARLENAIAAAAIDARRADYELARVAASTFYTSLQLELDRVDSGFAAGAVERLRQILMQRDDVITLLARSDAAAALRVEEIYLAYRRAVDASP